MNLAELIAQFRVDNDDQRKPYLFSDELLTTLFNDAEEEAALRANLIFESTNPAICTVPVTAGEVKYDLHESIFHVTYATFTADGSEEVCELKVAGRLTADLARSRRRLDAGKPSAIIVDDTFLELDCLPESDGTLQLEAYRAPLEKMAKEKDTPEIGRAHHRFLSKWVEHRAYSRPDTETFNPQRAQRSEEQFTAQFGNRPDADQRRAAQADAPPHNTAYY